MARKNKSKSNTQDEVVVGGDSFVEEPIRKTYVIKSAGHRHNGVVMNIGDEITPSNDAQADFLKSINII